MPQHYFAPSRLQEPQRLTLLRLLPLNRSAERGQRIQIRRRMVTDQIDRPCAEQDERRRNGDDGSTDHGAAPVILARLDKKSELRNVYWLALF